MQYKSQLKQKNNNLIIWVFLGIVLLVTYLIGSAYITNINQSKKIVLHKLSAVVNTAASAIDGNLHHQLSSKYQLKDQITRIEQDSMYYQLHTALKNIHDINDLQSPLYTMVFDERNSSFEFIVSSSIYPYYRHKHQQYSEDLKTHFDTEDTLDVYRSENDKWLSAYSPIKNSKGRTIALLQADQSFESFIVQARNELLQNIILALIIILPFAFLLYTYVKNTLDKDDKNRELLIKKNEHIASQNSFIQANNNKLKAAQIIIEQKNLELNAKVKDRTKELTKSNEELSTFLYRSSHDVQGPLTTLQGLCQLAHKDITDPQASAYVYMINETTNKLYYAIKSINNVYEIKHITTKAEKIKLKPLIKQISENLQIDMDAKGISLNTEIQDSLMLSVDKRVLELVLTELIKNSIQFNSRLNSDMPYIRIIAQQYKSSVQIEVEDNGLGVSEDTRSILFDMFQKGTEHSNGAGLGLYTAKIGVQKLNGKIYLSTKNNETTSFKIVVPAA